MSIGWSDDEAGLPWFRILEALKGGGERWFVPFVAGLTSISRAIGFVADPIPGEGVDAVCDDNRLT